MRSPVLTVLTVIAASAAAARASGAEAAQTPRQVYDHYVDCSSNMLAAQAGAARQDPQRANDPKFDAMMKTMRDKAVAAGAALSIPADRVSLQIGQGRDRLVRDLDQPDAAKAKAARKEVGMTTLSCAFDELGKAIAARKAQAAAPAAK